MLEAEKVCTKCGLELPLAMFSLRSRKRGGRKPACKSCDAVYYAAHKAENADKRRVYRENNRDNIREQNAAYQTQNRATILERRAWYRAANREKIRQRTNAKADKQKAYRLTEKGKAVRATSHQRYRKKYPDRWSANRALSIAVMSGDVVRPCKCEGPGPVHSDDVLHGHHVDYSKPLSVVWLCRKCHAAEHRRLRAEE
jgi:hypothetical protein